MNIFIGIDPSINSTGITIQKFNNDKLVNQKFYIIKPNKLTKKEEKVCIKNFEYIIYEKFDTSQYKDTHLTEYYKTLSLINISNAILELINKYPHTKEDTIIIVMEGISYGSVSKTKSIYDLAGLNYLIRYNIISHINKNEHIKLIICPPSEIKKFASGKGNSTKDILIEAFLILYSQFSIISKIDDLVDSYFMCQYGKEIYLRNFTSNAIN